MDITWNKVEIIWKFRSELDFDMTTKLFATRKSDNDVIYNGIGIYVSSSPRSVDTNEYSQIAIFTRSLYNFSTPPLRLRKKQFSKIGLNPRWSRSHPYRRVINYVGELCGHINLENFLDTLSTYFREDFIKYNRKKGIGFIHTADIHLFCKFLLNIDNSDSILHNELLQLSVSDLTEDMFALVMLLLDLFYNCNVRVQYSGELLGYTLHLRTGIDLNDSFYTENPICLGLGLRSKADITGFDMIDEPINTLRSGYGIFGTAYFINSACDISSQNCSISHSDHSVEIWVYSSSSARYELFGLAVVLYVVTTSSNISKNNRELLWAYGKFCALI